MNRLEGVLRIGVVGYSPPTRFDEVKAIELICTAYDNLQREYPTAHKTVVSGYTDTGISFFAYREATLRNWRTAGIACHKAREYPLYPCDEALLVGENWGDESSTFLQSIDVLVRIGGGKQSHAESARFKEITAAHYRALAVQEFELSSL